MCGILTDSSKLPLSFLAGTKDTGHNTSVTPQTMLKETVSQEIGMFVSYYNISETIVARESMSSELKRLNPILTVNSFDMLYHRLFASSLKSVSIVYFMTDRFNFEQVSVVFFCSRDTEV